MIVLSRNLRPVLVLTGLLLPFSAFGDTTGQPLQLAPQQGTVQQPQLPATLHDIHGPVALPEPLNMITLILIALAVLLIGIALFWWLRKRKSHAAPAIPPAVIARDQLMRAREMMRPESALDYMEHVSSILRSYLEARFHLPARRQTTREFLASAVYEEDALGKFTPALQHCLEQCDMAKFAHQSAGIDHLQEMEERILIFVNATELPEQPAPGEKR